MRTDREAKEEAGRRGRLLRRTKVLRRALVAAFASNPVQPFPDNRPEFRRFEASRAVARTDASLSGRLVSLPGVLDEGGLPEGWRAVVQVGDHRLWLVEARDVWTLVFVRNVGSGSIASAPRDGNTVFECAYEEYETIAEVLVYLRVAFSQDVSDALLATAVGWLDPAAHSPELFLYALSGGTDHTIAEAITVASTRDRSPRPSGAVVQVSP